MADVTRAEAKRRVCRVLAAFCAEQVTIDGWVYDHKGGDRERVIAALRDLEREMRRRGGQQSLDFTCATSGSLKA